MIYIVSPFENVRERRGVRNIKIANMLSENNDVVFITSDFSHQGKRKLVSSGGEYKKEQYSELIIRVPEYYKNISIRRIFCHFVFSIKVFFYLHRHLKPGDKILCPSIPIEVSSVVSQLKRLGAETTVDIRDVWPEAFDMQSGLKKFFFKVYCNFFYMCMRKYDKVIFSAPSFREYLNRFSNKESCFLYAPLGFDEERWGEPNQSRYLNDTNPQLRLVYVGNLETQCPLVNVIKAVNACKGLALVIIGDGSLRSYYEDISGDRVNFLGRLEPEQVVFQLATCHAGVLPFLGRSALPNKFFDYLASGLPVISIGEHDASSIIRDFDIGYGYSFSDDLIKEFSSITYHSIKIKAANVLKVRKKFSLQKIYMDVVRLICE